MKKFFALLAVVALFGCRGGKDLEAETSDPEHFGATVSYDFEFDKKKKTARFVSIVIQLTDRSTNKTKTYTLDPDTETSQLTQDKVITQNDNSKIQVVHVKNVHVVEDKSLKAELELGFFSSGTLSDPVMTIGGFVYLNKLDADGNEGEVVVLTIDDHEVSLRD